MDDNEPISKYGVFFQMRESVLGRLVVAATSIRRLKLTEEFAFMVSGEFEPVLEQSLEQFAQQVDCLRDQFCKSATIDLASVQSELMKLRGQIRSDLSSRFAADEIAKLLVADLTRLDAQGASSPVSART